ncbi:Pvc16 family protein [Paractinoplanes durhamensis]|uniref:Pvc16 N-terminal domain-containing protein n=1 Tax=Paractinoplanes durhamensis TaxID=113563 RepID=A0ABQ3Z769_9ACTN|nr:Pvc16 family protein [Actinoplanes durhamensis]GIE05672.1 hypothetical protein Adu01nite_70220 [Actinoplanes durhamensis]
MSASTALGMVSSSLRNMLIGELELGLTVGVTVLSPDEAASSDRRINLFLYRVQENPFLRNAEPSVRPGNPPVLIPPPLSLTAHYLMTAYAPNDTQTGNATAQQILGEAMRVFHDFAVVPPVYLDAGLITAREELRVTLGTLDPEQIGQLWSTFTKPYRLSVLYQVSTIQLDARPDDDTAVPQRVRQVGVPGVIQFAGPPIVDDAGPAAGPPGTTITFTGRHLAGHRARVEMAGVPLLDGTVLTGGETFTATVPDDLEAGFYDLRVDVSHLFRRLFPFEVTA